MYLYFWGQSLSPESCRELTFQYGLHITPHITSLAIISRIHPDADLVKSVLVVRTPPPPFFSFFFVTWGPSRGGGAGSTTMHTNVHKGGGGYDHEQNTHFVRRFIENDLSPLYSTLKDFIIGESRLCIEGEAFVWDVRPTIPQRQTHKKIH